MGTAHAHRDGAQVELRRRTRGNQNSLEMSAHNPKVDDTKVTEARLREGAVAKALLERMTEAAVMRINEMSQDEMKQWGQVLKDSKANPEAPCPALEIRDAAAEILLEGDAPTRVADPGDGATLAQALAQSETPRKGHHGGGGRQSINLPLSPRPPPLSPRPP